MVIFSLSRTTISLFLSPQISVTTGGVAQMVGHLLLQAWNPKL
jgi:hypothetical protein